MADSKPNILFVDDEDALRGVVAERLDGGRIRRLSRPPRRSGARPTAAVRLRHRHLRPAAAGHRRPRRSSTRRSNATPASSPSWSPATRPSRTRWTSIKRGAADFVAKPFQFDELLHVFRQALEQRRLQGRKRLSARAARRALRAWRDGRQEPRRCEALYQLIETVASSDAARFSSPARPGTGKEMVARAIHQKPARASSASSRSTAARFPRRCSRPSCSVTCAARSPARSATVRAASSRRIAGTLFLDEVGNDATALQMKLLRVLQEREFERIGDPDGQGGRAGRSRPPTRISRRMVARRNLPRGPLLPPERRRRCSCRRLRERLEDIPLLVARFIEKLLPPGNGASQSSSPGRDAPADGAQVARQRAPARKHHRARARARWRPPPHRRGRPARRHPWRGDGADADADASRVGRRSAGTRVSVSSAI